MFKKIALIALGAILIEIAIMPLRGYVNYMIAGVVGFVLYVGYVYCCIKKLKDTSPGVVLLAAILGWLMVHLPVRAFMWSESLVSLPEGCMHLIGIFAGYAIYRTHRYCRIMVLLASAVLCIGYYMAFPAWLHYLNFGTTSGRTEMVLKTPVSFQHAAGEDVALDSFHGQYLVLDFWNSSCGVCFREFPKIQAFHDEFAANDNVAIYGVFCRMPKRNETAGQGADILKAEGYTFPTLSLDKKDPILDSLGVNCFPTVVIIDPAGKMVFRGSADKAIKYAGENFMKK